MLITAVTQQKKRADRVSVYIDEKFAFGMSMTDCLYYHIKEGEQITQDRYNNILNELIYAKARDKAVKLLSFSPRTQMELTKKLSEEYSLDICERVIQMLKDYGYINDETFAKAYVRDSFNFKGWGSKKIYAQLKNKGIDQEQISAALEEADLDEAQRAAQLLKKRLKGNTDLDYKEKAKHYRYLAGRGFGYDAINAAFNIITGNNLEDEDGHNL